MARVTIEDCLQHTENRFELVLKSAERARRLELGEADPLVSVDNDKPTVIALREIAVGHDVSPKVIDEVEQAEKALFANPSDFMGRDQYAPASPSVSSIQDPISPTGLGNSSDPLTHFRDSKNKEEGEANE